jgi:hypothetical protein
MHAFLRATFRQRGTQVSRLAGRCASTARSSTNPYPYPSNSSPTPHQIFHLPLSASQEEVKSRCVHRLIDHSSPPALTLIPNPLDTADYELVRIYHPDSPIARVYPPEISEARFHAISTSYDVLRGRRPDHDPDPPHASLHPRVDLHALWRAKQRLRQDPLGPADDRWKDGVLFGSIIVVRSFPFDCHARIGEN